MANGSCLCGEVRFNISGDLSQMTHCHCSMCRKLHGSLFATMMRAEQLTYSQGEDYIGTHVASSELTRTFCKQCGSPLPEKSTNDGYYIPAGLLDDDPGIRPEAHIFTESKADCYTITDNLTQHVHYGDGNTDRVIEQPESPAKENAVTGGCQCGSVSFEYTGKPKMIMNCHCTRCRKAKGAAHATNAFVPADQLTWNSGKEKIQDYALPEAERFGHAFCRDCGSSVPRASADGAMYNVPVGSLNQAPCIEAKGHIFIGSKAPWFDVTDDKPQWDEMPS